MLHGVTVRSPSPRGRHPRHPLRRRHSLGRVHHRHGRATSPAPIVVALIIDDQPYLADGRVNHAEEPVVLLAHRRPGRCSRKRGGASRSRSTRCRRCSRSTRRSRAATIIWGADNIFKSLPRVARRRGRGAGARPTSIVEGEYETGAQEQLYIEPNGMLAVGAARATASRCGARCSARTTSTRRSPRCSTCPPRRSASSRWRPAAASAARKSTRRSSPATRRCWRGSPARPVKMIYDRAEDMVATTKRHPSRTRHRTGGHAGRPARRDGHRLRRSTAARTARCRRSCCRAARSTPPGPYFCPNVRVRGRAVATNAPPHGAFRGFGAPQSLFALERHMDLVAAAVGLAPEELRRRNFIQHRPDERRRAGDARAGRHGRRCSIARSRCRTITPSARGSPRANPRAPREEGHRLRRVHARRGLHRLGRGSPRVGRRRRGDAPTAACAC